jgi:penicillin-binding protein 1A
VVLANGKEDDEAGWGKARRKRVFSDGVAYEVTKILERNMTGGTGTGAYFGRPAAGKTGTTDNWTDAWFCGYTPNLATAVWVGYPNAQVEMTSVHGIRVAGGTFPAEIWNLFMSAALGDTEPLDWEYPKNPVDWEPFDGQYAFDGAVPTTSASTGSTSTATTTAATTTVPVAPPTAPPPPAPEPPPPTVAPPPPPPEPPPPTGTVPP